MGKNIIKVSVSTWGTDPQCGHNTFEAGRSFEIEAGCGLWKSFRSMIDDIHGSIKVTETTEPSKFGGIRIDAVDDQGKSKTMLYNVDCYPHALDGDRKIAGWLYENKINYQKR